MPVPASGSLVPPSKPEATSFNRKRGRLTLTVRGRCRPEEVIATATAITARSIGQSLERFVITRNSRYRDYVVSGGGVKNQALMKRLAEQVIPLGLRLQRMEDYGVESEAKEALAFAVLAYQTWRKRPSNLPSATGARRAVVLGKISLP